MEPLPCEVECLILAWLAAEQATRCRLVCRRWRELISTAGVVRTLRCRADQLHGACRVVCCCSMASPDDRFSGVGHLPDDFGASGLAVGEHLPARRSAPVSLARLHSTLVTDPGRRCDPPMHRVGAAESRADRRTTASPPTRRAATTHEESQPLARVSPRDEPSPHRVSFESKSKRTRPPRESLSSPRAALPDVRSRRSCNTLCRCESYWAVERGRLASRQRRRLRQCTLARGWS